MSSDLQSAKGTVRQYQAALSNATAANVANILAANVHDDFFWRGMRPFYEQKGATAVAAEFWQPLLQSFTAMNRREDVFFAGTNDAQDDGKVWVASMGYLMGLFDEDWLHIPATRKLAYLRYAEFCCVEDGKITESAMFCDIIGLMQQAGVFPLPPQTGAVILPPGPATHDGIRNDASATSAAIKTLHILNRMIDDLSELNDSDVDRCPPELLRRSWHEHMIWHGPAGIGSTYTIPRYQQQHQYPFREQLKDKVFNGHIARIAEGNYAGFFGWSNLTNTPTGGFLGMPGNDTRADMRVVDIYRREDDKLVENWVFIDLPHWLSMQGLDVLKRMQQLRNQPA